MTGKNILIVSNEPWGDVWFSKHHYALELSKTNQVFFLNSPGSWKLPHLWSNRVIMTRVKDNLEVLSYNNYLPFTGRFEFLRSINNRLIYSLLKKHLRQKNFYPFIFWSFDPIRLEEPGRLHPELSLFYSVDNHSHGTEGDLVRNSDLVLVVTPFLEKKYRELKKPLYLVPHGVPVNRLSTEHILAHKPKKQILFMGSVDHRMNYKQVSMAAEQLPLFTFKMIGKINKSNFTENDHKDFNELEKRPNVIFTGAMSFNLLHGEILDSAVCLLISKQELINNTLNSLKILQYLAYGKPVVSCRFEMYSNSSPGLIYQYSSDEEFVKLVTEKATVPEPDDIKAMRIEYTKQFEYPRLIARIGEYISKHMKR